MNETNPVEKHVSATVADQKKIWVPPTAIIEQVKNVTQNGTVNRPAGDGITLTCSS